MTETDLKCWKLLDELLGRHLVTTVYYSWRNFGLYLVLRTNRRHMKVLPE